jgi:uncharacterized membrane protein
MIPLVILLLAAISFLIATYFTAVSYRWLDPEASWIPSFCRMGERTCSSIVFTPRARVLGLPNSVLGQIFYLVLVAGILGNFIVSPPFLYFYLAGSLLTVLLGVFLTYSLLFITRVPCKLCFTSHAINLAIFILLLVHGL